MSERKTGATSAQIEAAAKRDYDQKCPDFAWEYRTEEYRANRRAVVGLGAINLVPPGYAIVSRDDLRAVLGLVDAFLTEYGTSDGNYAVVMRLREVCGE